MSVAEVIENYSQEELAAELRMRYESVKSKEAEAELANLMYLFEEYASPEVAAKFYPLREQIDEAIKAGTLSENFTPAEFVVWVRSHGIALPEELKQAIKKRNVLYELRARCDSLSAERDALRLEADELRAELEEVKKKKPSAIVKDALPHGLRDGAV